MAKISSIALATVMACLIFTGSQQSTGLDDLLKKEISVPAHQALPGMRIGAILLATRLRGGIEEKDESCASGSSQQFPDFHGSIEEAVRSVTSPDGGYYSWQERDGTLFIRSSPVKPSLLDTKIASFSFHLNENPLTVQGRLFDLPEVRKRVAELKLYQREPEIGFSRLRRPQTEEPPVLLQDLSLRDALAGITAKHSDRLVWSYLEYTCNGTTYSQFNWLSK